MCGVCELGGELCGEVSEVVEDVGEEVWCVRGEEVCPVVCVDGTRVFGVVPVPDFGEQRADVLGGVFGGHEPLAVADEDGLQGGRSSEVAEGFPATGAGRVYGGELGEERDEGSRYVGVVVKPACLYPGGVEGYLVWPELCVMFFPYDGA